MESSLVDSFRLLKLYLPISFSFVVHESAQKAKVVVVNHPGDHFSLAPLSFENSFSETVFVGSLAVGFAFSKTSCIHSFLSNQNTIFYWQYFSINLFKLAFKISCISENTNQIFSQVVDVVSISMQFPAVFVAFLIFVLEERFLPQGLDGLIQFLANSQDDNFERSVDHILAIERLPLYVVLIHKGDLLHIDS